MKKWNFCKNSFTKKQSYRTKERTRIATMRSQMSVCLSAHSFVSLWSYKAQTKSNPFDRWTDIRTDGLFSLARWPPVDYFLLSHCVWVRWVVFASLWKSYFFLVSHGVFSWILWRNSLLFWRVAPLSRSLLCLADFLVRFAIGFCFWVDIFVCLVLFCTGITCKLRDPCDYHVRVWHSLWLSQLAFKRNATCHLLHVCPAVDRCPSVRSFIAFFLFCTAWSWAMVTDCSVEWLQSPTLSSPSSSVTINIDIGQH